MPCDIDVKYLYNGSRRIPFLMCIIYESQCLKCSFTIKIYNLKPKKKKKKEARHIIRVTYMLATYIGKYPLLIRCHYWHSIFNLCGGGCTKSFNFSSSLYFVLRYKCIRAAPLIISSSTKYLIVNETTITIIWGRCWCCVIIFERHDAR